MPKTGRAILLFEIEEIAELVGSSDEIGNVCIIGTDSTSNRTFIKKKSQAQP
jgi:hypothetical protein